MSEYDLYGQAKKTRWPKSVGVKTNKSYMYMDSTVSAYTGISR
jgi:hypothetical protein